MNNNIDKKEILDWLIQSIGIHGLAITIRFNEPPKTKEELCIRCKHIFCKLFRRLLGRHWRKIYPPRFRLIGFQEFGKFGNVHAHFTLGMREFWPEDAIPEFKSIANHLKMNVWDHDEDKPKDPTNTIGDIMVKKIYSKGTLVYTIKELSIKQDKRMNDTIITDADIIS